MDKTSVKRAIQRRRKRGFYSKAVLVKKLEKQGYNAYFSKDQIEKLSSFLDQLIPLPRQCKHVVLAAHIGRRWIFREISWEDWKGAD
jgi:hypothetical protein